MDRPFYIQQVLCPLDHARCESSCNMYSQEERHPNRGKIFCQLVGGRIAVIDGVAYKKTDTPYFDPETFARYRADYLAMYGGRA